MTEYLKKTVSSYSHKLSSLIFTGTEVWCGTKNASVYRLASNNGELISKFTLGRRKEGKETSDYVVEFALGFDMVFAGNYNGSIRIYSKKGEHLQKVPSGCGHVCGLTVCAPLNLVAAAGDQGISLFSFDQVTTKLTRQSVSSRLAELCATALTLISVKKSFQLWVALADGTLRILSFPELDELKVHSRVHAHSPCSLAACGSLVCAGGKDGTISLFDTTSLSRVGVLTAHEAKVTRLCAGRSPAELWSASGDKTLRVWDTKERALLATLKGHTAAVSAMVVLLDEVWSASADQTIRIWNQSALRAASPPTAAALPVKRQLDLDQALEPSRAKENVGNSPSDLESSLDGGSGARGAAQEVEDDDDDMDISDFELSENETARMLQDLSDESEASTRAALAEPSPPGPAAARSRNGRRSTSTPSHSKSSVKQPPPGESSPTPSVASSVSLVDVSSPRGSQTGSVSMRKSKRTKTYSDMNNKHRSPSLASPAQSQRPAHTSSSTARRRFKMASPLAASPSTNSVLGTGRPLSETTVDTELAHLYCQAYEGRKAQEEMAKEVAAAKRSSALQKKAHAKELECVRADAETLQADLAAERELRARDQAMVAELRRAVDAVSKDLLEEQKRNFTTDQELQQTKQQLSKLEKSRTSSKKEYAQALVQRDALLEENSRLQGNLHAEKERRKMAEGASGRMNESTRKAAAMHTRDQHALAKMETACEALQKELAALHRRNKDLTDMLQQARAERDDAQTRGEEAALAAETSQDELEALRRVSQALESNEHRLEDDCARLKTQYRTLSQQCEEDQKLHAAALAQERELRADAENARLEWQALYEELSTQVHGSGPGSLQAAREEGAREAQAAFTQEHYALNDEMHDLMDKTSVEKAETSHTMQRALVENEELSTSLERTQSSLQATKEKLKASEEKREALEAQLSEQQLVVKRLKASSARMAVQLEAAENLYKTALDDHRAKLDEARQKQHKAKELARMDLELERRATLTESNKRKTLQSQLDKLTAELAESQQEAEGLRAQLDQANETVRKSKQENAENLLKLDEVIEETEGLKVTTAQQELTVQHLQRQLDEIEAEKKGENDGEEEVEVQTLRKARQAALEDCDRLESQLARVKKELEELKLSNGGGTGSLANEETEEENEKLKGQVALLTMQVEQGLRDQVDVHKQLQEKNKYEEAYFELKDFCEKKGISVPPLSEFEDESNFEGETDVEEEEEEESELESEMDSELSEEEESGLTSDED